MNFDLCEVNYLAINFCNQICYHNINYEIIMIVRDIKQYFDYRGKDAYLPNSRIFINYCREKQWMMALDAFSSFVNDYAMITTNFNLLTYSSLLFDLIRCANFTEYEKKYHCHNCKALFDDKSTCLCAFELN
jgi:hypothetical protein